MPITLPADDRQRAVAALCRYADDELGLGFVLREIGPSVHSR